jgi:hypothetical protein
VKKKIGRFPTTGRIGRIVKVLDRVSGRTAVEKVMKGVDRFTGLSRPEEKADWMRHMIVRMEKTIGLGPTARVMRDCGRMCCGVTSRKRANAVKKRSPALEGMIAELNRMRVGGGRLKIVDEHTIKGGYDRCYCGLVGKTVDKFPDLNYCACSTGWYQQLFETLLGHPVKVEIAQSIICGAKTCEFVIRIQ